MYLIFYTHYYIDKYIIYGYSIIDKFAIKERMELWVGNIQMKIEQVISIFS